MRIFCWKHRRPCEMPFPSIAENTRIEIGTYFQCHRFVLSLTLSILLFFGNDFSIFLILGRNNGDRQLGIDCEVSIIEYMCRVKPHTILERNFIIEWYYYHVLLDTDTIALCMLCVFNFLSDSIDLFYAPIYLSISLFPSISFRRNCALVLHAVNQYRIDIC